MAFSFFAPSGTRQKELIEVTHFTATSQHVFVSTYSTVSTCQ